MDDGKFFLGQCKRDRCLLGVVQGGVIEHGRVWGRIDSVRLWLCGPFLVETLTETSDIHKKAALPGALLSTQNQSALFSDFS